MRFPIKFSLAVLIALGGYLFWPRASSLAAFDPVAMAELHVGIRRHEANGGASRILLDLYGILHGQYRIPPIPAFSAAVEMLQARRAFAQAADQADEEKALPHLEKAFSIIDGATGSMADPKIMARLELFAWSLLGDETKQRQLVEAISEKLALLHGGAAKNYQDAAGDFAQARRFALAEKWDAASRTETAAWRKLQLQIDRSNALRADQREMEPSAGSSRNSQL